jgi:hypothetical protein
MANPERMLNPAPTRKLPGKRQVMPSRPVYLLASLPGCLLACLPACLPALPAVYLPFARCLLPAACLDLLDLELDLG